MRVKVLASGSKGNATIISTPSTSILIDCGISFRQILARQSFSRKDDFKNDALFVTHEHHDHIGGLNSLLGNHPTKVFLSAGTYEKLDLKFYDKLNANDVKIIKEWDNVFIGDLVVTAFNLSHDTSEPLGYIIEHENKKIVYITDTGYLNSNYYPYLQNADLYILESNHDLEMLLNSDRDFRLKERIFSDRGHLSNEDSAFNFYRLKGEKTKKIILAHLSEECNTEEKAITTYFEVFENVNSELNDVEILIAKQNYLLETDI